jgi:hypothetical protein
VEGVFLAAISLLEECPKDKGSLEEISLRAFSLLPLAAASPPLDLGLGLEL